MKLYVSTLSQIPIYQQLIDQIKQLILTNSIQMGELLPSIRSLARELHIGIITVKRAYEELQKEGYIISQSGVGYFIAQIDTQQVKEARREILKEQLTEIRKSAFSEGLNDSDIIEILNELMKEKINE